MFLAKLLAWKPHIIGFTHARLFPILYLRGFHVSLTHSRLARSYDSLPIGIQPSHMIINLHGNFVGHSLLQNKPISMAINKKIDLSLQAFIWQIQ